LRGRCGPEGARLERGVLPDPVPRQVLDLVVAVEREGEAVGIVEAGKGIVARLEHEDGLAGRRQHVRDRGAPRPAADHADVETREAAVAEDGLLGSPAAAAYSLHVTPSAAVSVTTASSIACPAAVSGFGARVPSGRSSSGSGVETGWPGSSL